MKFDTLKRLKRISMSVTKPRKRRLYAKKMSFSMSGGPISTAHLCTPGTLVFRLGEWHGFYDRKNNWVQL